METFTIGTRRKTVYTITQGGLSITIFTNPDLPTREQVPFEDIKSERFLYTNTSPLFLLFGGVIGLIGVFMLIVREENVASYQFVNFSLLILSAVSIACYFWIKPKFFFLKTHNRKFIKFRIKKNEREVASFVDQVIQQRNEYLKLKYGQPNAYLPYDTQYSNFNILLREGIITAEEYQKNITTLNSEFEQTTPSRTFPNYSQN